MKALSMTEEQYLKVKEAEYKYLFLVDKFYTKYSDDFFKENKQRPSITEYEEYVDKLVEEADIIINTDLLESYQ